ncbi:MAG: N-formylglutamate amidohydrolase [Pseudomonadota bacterium]
MHAFEPALHDHIDPSQETSQSDPADDANVGTGIEAVEVFNPGGKAPVLILSDHSGCDIPAYLDDLGLSLEERRRHIAWDIGTTDMTRRLASRLDATAVLNHVSRLVIDPNRDPYSATSIPAVADGTFVPGNQDLSLEEQQRRIRISFIPYHRAISKEIARLRREVGIPVIIAMHSFTPEMQREWRPWEAGVLFGEDDRLAMPVLERLRAETSFCIGANQPYSGNHPDSYSLQFHALRPGFPNVAFEVRQDQIATKSDAEAWADRLARVLQPSLSDPTLYRLWGSWRRLVDVDYAAVTDARGRRRIPAG